MNKLQKIALFTALCATNQEIISSSSSQAVLNTRQELNPEARRVLDSILIKAICDGDINQVARLISKGADVNCCDYPKGSPIVVALKSNQLEIIKLLHSYGGKIKTNSAHQK